MGFFSDVVDFVVSPIKHVVDIGKKAVDVVDETLLGGAEEEAARKSEQAARTSKQMWKNYRKRADELYAPYETLGPDNLNLYKAAALDDSGGPPLPDYPRQGEFQYGGKIPEYNDVGNVPSFNYAGDIPTFDNTGNVPDVSLPGYGGSPEFQFNPMAIADNPDYQFRLNQGIEAINRGAGAVGKRLSGNRAIDLMEFGQGLASTELGNAFSRALAGSKENQSRRVGDYSLAYQRAGDQATLDRLREAEMYGRGLNIYDIARQNEADRYGRTLTDYDISRANEATRYGRGLNIYDIARDVESDRYGRATGEYGMEGARLAREFSGDVAISDARYNREQERINRIAELINMGYSASAARDIADRSATSGASGATIDIGNAQAAGELGKTAARRNLFSDALLFFGAGGFGGGASQATPVTRWT